MKFPGPGAYIPQDKSDGPKYSFGGAGVKDSSMGHSGGGKDGRKGGKELDQTPGPGSYTVKTGKGHARTFGDAPCMKFTEAKRGEAKSESPTLPINII
jgi:hypothetical protein